jgi:CBS domain containing-hemolysin-like protein
MNFELGSIIGFVVILVLDLVAVATRSGLRNTNLTRVYQLREQLGEGANRLLSLMDASPRPYAGMQIFQGICRFALVGLFLNVVSWQHGTLPALIAWVLLLVAGIVVALLEWTVERRVSLSPENWVHRLGLFIQVISVILFPLIQVSFWLSNEKELRPDSQSMVTEDELKLLVEAGQQEGVLEQEEGQMIFSIFQLGDTLTREIMVPRIDMLAIDIQTPLPEALDVLLESGYSRVPVFEGRVDNIIGILYAKDLLKVWRDGNGSGDDIRSLLREPYFVPEAKKVDELLAEMQHRRVHMAIVVDEYGGVAGAVTLEDVIEEILGEIQDEFDVEDMPFQGMEDGSYLFRGRIDLDDFNQIMNSSLPPEEADTLSGFIYGRLGHVPVAGERVEVDGLQLSVEQVSNRRIRLVRARHVLVDGEPDGDG